MERTVLLFASESTDQEPNLQFETIQGAHVLLGGGEGAPGRETPGTRFCINISAKAFHRGDQDFTEPVHLQIWITPTQIAEIAIHFFHDFFFHTKPVFKEMFERVFRKRWQVMTSSLYREELFPGGERVASYHKLR